ncbi:hypothetical protein Trydic_g10287 [Trypoxylus dichotomus]
MCHQSSPGHGQDRRPDNTYQTAGGNGRPRRYPRLPIRVPQRAQHHSPGRLVERIKEGFNRRECTGAVILDVAKAFDKVWHQGLLLCQNPLNYSTTV